MKKFYLYLLLTFGLSYIHLQANENYSSKECACNMNTEDVLKAINHLEKGYSLSKSIEDADTRLVVSSHFKVALDCLKKDFLINNYDNVTDLCITLNDNIDEILADCQNEQLRIDITNCVSDMMKSVGQGH